ncbi:DMT family transporter [candidate division KSB1 bacterium]|nr:DMT family transporter [candidate division KSB1 bacterium]
MKNILLYISVILIWGSTWLAVKMQLGVVDPMITIIYRFLFGSIVIFAFCFATRRPMKYSRKVHLGLFFQGVCTFAVNYWFFYQAQQILTSGLAAVIFSLLVFMNLVNALIFLNMKIQPIVLLGAFIGLAGIVMLFQPEFGRIEMSGNTLLMIGFGLLGTYIFSIGNIGVRTDSETGIAGDPDDGIQYALRCVIPSRDCVD